MTTYRKSMSQALNEVYLGEDNMDLLKKAAGGAMQTLKMKDGKVKMDSFTASAIMGVYKAINPKNKKTLENVINTGTKSALMKLQSLAMRSIKSGYHEEVELDEAKLNIKKIHKAVDDGKSMDVIVGMFADKRTTNTDEIRKIVRDYKFKKRMKEEIELDEKIQDIPDKKLKFYKSVPHPSYTKKEIEDEILRRKKTGDSVKEEVELGEAVKYQFVAIDRLGKVIGFASDERDAKDMARRGHTMDSPSKGKGVVGRNKAKVVKLHKPISPKEGDKLINREFDIRPSKGDKTVFSIGLKEEVELDEASARADAKRAMRKDKEVDPADVDDIATDDDVKAASKNIMMQMRKVISLRGNFKVEFGDKKKMKIDPKIARAVQDKYDSIKRPMDKQKFTNTVSKSYKDMLAALKESLGEEKSARQLINPNKEVMVVNKNKVIVIDKKDEDKYLKKGWKLAEEVELDEAKGNQKSQGMFIVLEKGSKNKVIGQFKEKDKAMKMMKKSAGAKVIQIGEFATVDDKPVDIKVGDELSYTRVKLSKKIKEEVDLDEKRKDSVSLWLGKKDPFNLKKQKSHGKPVFKGTPAEIKKQMKAWKKKHDKIGIGEDMTVTAATDGGISQRDLDHVQKELRKLGIKDAVVDQNEMDKDKIDVKTKMSDDKVKKAFDKSKMTVIYNHVQMEGTWGLPDTPELKAGLKKLMKKPIPLGKDGDDAIKAIGKYIGDDGLYDDLYDAGKKDGPKADARPVISGWMDREFVGSWKKYRLVGMGRRHSTIETTTILNRIGQKIQERKNG